MLKRGLPRALLTDNGAPMVAKATVEGLHRLGILHCTTLPYSPEQNAKNEVFWAHVEGRLMAMLEGEKALTLSLLNRATQAWAELDYNRKLHSELGDNPLHVALTASSVMRPAPDSRTLRRAFRVQETRAQRISDGTITVCGVRFELPSRYRTLRRPAVRFAPWDLSSVDLVDARTDKVLCELYPLDKRANADGKRRPLEPIGTSSKEAPEKGMQPSEPTPEPAGIAPLLQTLMAEYAATGLPPAYLPHGPDSQSTEKEDNS